ncbi:peptide ABC transporter ATPase [Ignicoccus islandicus DSM 13165]|uniref:Peptide ABC transporter ATPase n=1 Tax=Ignicoccus islandicus DSM 13165 TaxID=940295 RepID=A0A0U3F843_9CREN|nr:ABC transporter ATP-binding protein [Ignicoccus islandicus]ALU11801.1 peptide ABC transporter ATPase [Ignicoccus islandicus DSM 13165]
MIEVNDLKVYYYSYRGVVKAVDGVSFQLREGRSLGIAGESGCGKSTTAMALMRLIEPPGKIVNGSIKIDDADILQLDEKTLRKEIRWKKISMVFQGAMNSLTPVYTVFQHFVETAKAHGYQAGKEELREKAIELLKKVGLKEDVLYRYPHELSGGQKQRVVIALALLLNPKYLIADEPTTALDVVVQAQILNELKKLQESGISVILITHDLGVLSELSDDVMVMYAGKVVEYGPIEKVLGNPLHPYTKLLLDATPKLRGGELKWIPGSPPNLIDPPRGCRFGPRCPYRFDKCDTEPELIEVEHNHWVACHLYR